MIFKKIPLRLDRLQAIPQFAKKYLKHFLYVLLAVSILLVAYFSTEYYYKSVVVDLPRVKKFTRDFIRNELGRAVDFGVLDFSIINGLLIEDIQISKGDDFSDKEVLLKSDRVRIELKSVFSGKPWIKRIIVKNAIITADREDSVLLSLSDYISRMDIPEIKIENMSLAIRKNDSVLIHLNTNLDVLIRKKKNVVKFEFTESNLSFFQTAVLEGNGEYYLDENNFTLEARFSKLDISSFSGVLEKIYFTKNPRGLVEGNLQWVKSVNDEKLNGKIYSPKLSFNNHLFEKRFFLKEMNHSFAYKVTPNSKDYNGEFSSERFKLKLVGKNNLEYNLSFFSNNLSSVLGGEMQNPEESCKAELTLLFDEKKSDWLKVSGGLNLSRFDYITKEVNLKLNNLSFSINPSGKMKLFADALLFGEKAKMTAEGDLSLLKLYLSQGEFYYPLKSNLTVNAQLEKADVKNYIPLLNNFSDYIDESVKERERKLLDTTLFLSQPFYKNFLRESRLKLKLQLGNLFHNDTSQGTWTADIVNENSSFRALILGENGNIINTSYTYNTALPFVNFSWKLNLPWKGETVSWCGKKIQSEALELETFFTSSGNNFMQLLNTAGMKNRFVLKKNQVENSNLPESKFEEISFETEGYGANGVIRSLTIQWEKLKLTGYGNYYKNSVDYSLYGSYDNQAVSYRLTSDGKQCKLN